MKKQKIILKPKFVETKINWIVSDLDLQAKALIYVEGLSLKYQKLEMLKGINQFDVSNLGKLADGDSASLILTLKNLKDEQVILKDKLTKDKQNSDPVLLARLNKIEAKIIEQAMPLMKDPEVMRRLMSYNSQDDEEVTKLRIDISKQEIELYTVILLGLNPESKAIAKELYNVRSSNHRLEVISGFANELENFASDELKVLWNRQMREQEEKMMGALKTQGL